MLRSVCAGVRGYFTFIEKLRNLDKIRQFFNKRKKKVKAYMLLGNEKNVRYEVKNEYKHAQYAAFPGV